MTVETRSFAKIPRLAIETIAELDRKSRSALDRAAKAPVGDRTDVFRFEILQTEIEGLAIAAVNDGAPCIHENGPASLQPRNCVVRMDCFPDDLSTNAAQQIQSWIAEGALVVEYSSPLCLGSTAIPEGTGAIRSPAEPWKSESGNRGKDAVRERFLAQLESATSGQATEPSVIIPSGVSNSVLTDGLRTFATRKSGFSPVDVPVAYRDGSSARPFPLRGLDLVDDREPIGRVLTFSMLSIRHVALDSLVDGAWLRNSEISRLRPAGDTDEMVYLESIRQLKILCKDQQTTIVMYQTGLETAIMGFYRAVVEELANQFANHRRNLMVLPRFFQSGDDYVSGRAWRVR